ncbi:MAG: RsmE family RNA methyltransferase [Thermodesulfobacteriota bacterium]
MNIILVDREEVTAAGLIRLADHRAAHLVGILKKAAGDTVRLGIIGGAAGTARILALAEDGSVELFFQAADAARRPPFDLILALPRPIMLQRILFQAPQLGVARIFLIRSERVEKSYFQATLLREAEYSRVLRAGMEQAEETWMPEIHIVPRFRRFLDEVLPLHAADWQAAFVAHPEGGVPLRQHLNLPLAGRAVVAIGPEGGWIPYETSGFRKRGFLPVSLGRRILRVETAIPVLLGQLQLFLPPEGFSSSP